MKKEECGMKKQFVDRSSWFPHPAFEHE